MLKLQAETTASFKVSYLLAKICKPFYEGEFVKETFLEMSDLLFNDFKNKSEIIAAIQDLQLSRKTVMRRIEKMSGNPLWGKYCDGGHFCSAPKECCTLGCCYHPPPNSRMFNVLFLGHWYFWAIVTIALICLLCFCSLWRRCRILLHILCCFVSNRDERASEPDSTGSFYAPPQYSRCNSFHHAPPPYTEVTSKPDLYPLVINYNGDTGMKHGGSASYLMVQYFRNYILRPSGSISATSTIDSLSSSFICNAVNEANTIVPPPYSCTGSLDGFSITANTTTDMQMLHSVSSVMCNEYQQTHSSSGHSQQSIAVQPTPCSSPSRISLNTHYSAQSTNYTQAPNGTSPIAISTSPNSVQITPNYIPSKTTNFVNNISAKCGSSQIETNESKINNYINSETIIHNICSDTKANDLAENIESCYHLVQAKKPAHLLLQKKKNVSADNSVDSETSLGEDHNFSELLNLSVCAPSSIINCHIGELSNGDFGIHTNLSELQQTYSIANSITVSDISSLANLGTPDSPPRATSPTVEIRELLDKIQQLPKQKSPTYEFFNYAETAQPVNSRFYVKNKSKTLYMPLNAAVNKIIPNNKQSTSLFSGTTNLFSYAGKTTKAWLSRSAPTTPCSNFTPLFPSQRKNIVSGSQKDSNVRVNDSCALLEGEYEHNNCDECL